MDLETIIQTTRAQIRAGNTGPALETLLPFVEKDSRYADIARTLQVVEANYNAARQQEQKGILSFQEAQRSYNQTNDTLISILDALASGRALQSMPNNGGARSTVRLWIIGGVILLALGIGVGWWLTARDTAPAIPTTNAAPEKDRAVACPSFPAVGQRILILPFQNIAEGKARPEIVIQARIQQLSSVNNFPLAPEVMLDYNSDVENPDVTKARKLAERCGAAIVIWGLYERGAGDSLLLDTRFVIANEDKEMRTGFQSLSSVSRISDGKMLKSLDDAIFSICGIMAARSGNMPLALKWLEKVKNPDANDAAILRDLHERDQ